MNLTKEQEDLVVRTFTPLVRGAVKKLLYANSSYMGKMDMDDCLQDCMIVFLKHIRKVPDMESIFPLPWYDFRHALCCHAQGRLPVSVPKHNTSHFTVLMQNFGDAVSADELIEDGFEFGGSHDGSYDEAEEATAFRSFFDALQAEDQQLLMDMSRSDNVSSLAREKNAVPSTIYRKLNRLKADYARFCE